MAVKPKPRNPRTHFTDPDYGLSISAKLGRVVLQLRYIDAGGDIKKISPTWSFLSEAGRSTAISEARKERDRLLALPEYQAYLALKYADPTGGSGLHVKPSKTSKGVISNLNGVFVDIHTSHPRVYGKRVNYVNIMAHAPGPDNKTKYRSWSIRKYGLRLALEKAAHWRYDYVRAQRPSSAELDIAEQIVLEEYRAYLNID